MVRHAEPGTVDRIESGGGPLMAVPEAVLPFWTGADGEETASDHDPACEVDGGPSDSCRSATSRPWCSATNPPRPPVCPTTQPSSAGAPRTPRTSCSAGVPEALRTARWEPEVCWRVPGPVLLFDAARPGSDCARTDHVRVALDPGRYAVRAAEVRPGPETWLNVVQLRRLTDR
ncbi:hypothetical protein GCM10010377_16430 [Streptomyces viridiviolaceus]|nr:hypothetical protein GCM10010377_16430 [Streptomyces viridiviolaceus]